VPQQNMLSSIEFLDLHTNQIGRIARFETSSIDGGLALSPDRQWILYTNRRADQGGAELRLVENFR